MIYTQGISLWQLLPGDLVAFRKRTQRNTRQGVESRGGAHGVTTGAERLNLDEKTIVICFSVNGPNSKIQQIPGKCRPSCRQDLSK